MPSVPSARRRVLVTGLGCIGSDGADIETFWARQLAAVPRITPITRFEPVEGTAAGHAAQVDDQLLEAADAGDVFRRADRHTRFAGHAMRAALMDAALSEGGPIGGAVAPSRIGLVIGSGAGGLMFQEAQMWDAIGRGRIRVHPHSVPRISPTALLSAGSRAFGIRGPGHVVSSACASGAHAVGQALRLIQQGDADVVVAVGTEAPLTPFALAAFSLLGVLARAEGDVPPACRPFDRDRAGFVLGEGAAALVLEAEDVVRRRGVRSYAEVAGYGQSLGGFHPVHVVSDGADAAAAIVAAMRDADVAPEQIGYVNAHGTGTRENDVAECHALHAALGRQAQSAAVSSSKPMTGHTLGAAGAIESVVTCLAVARGLLPPTAHHVQRDPACDVDVIAGAPRRAEVQAALCNAFGFGNINVSLIIKRAPA